MSLKKNLKTHGKIIPLIQLFLSEVDLDERRTAFIELAGGMVACSSTPWCQGGARQCFASVQ